MTKILLVEDDKSLREIYGVRLLAEGYDIVSAGDGEEALAMAIKDRPALIISDVMMPKISGFDMLDILRSTTETKGIRVIMMTALSSEDQRQRGESLGADRYLVKSQVGIEDVVRTVHEVLGDAPTTSSATPQAAVSTPSQPAPAASPRPAAAPFVPPRPPEPAPIAPTTPTPLPTPTPNPVSMPVSTAPQAPASTPFPPATQPVAAATAPSTASPFALPTPDPAPTATGGSLPQPTAPFSTTRPANLGERVIHPISAPEDAPDVASLIDKELNVSPNASAPATSSPDQPPVAF